MHLPALRITVVGAGRLGTALTIALRARDVPVVGPVRRGEPVPLSDVVLLAIPEREIASAAATLPQGTLAGHCSASEPLETLAPHERFNLHPLLPLARTAVAAPSDTFAGAAAAVDGSTPRAQSVARALATVLGMRPVHVPAAQRPLYHAAASMAANYLVTLESAAEQLAALTGITRAELAPLARASLEAWIAGGFQQAISGPVSRGDEAIVAGQRAAVERHRPALLPLFDALTSATRDAMATGR
jgi:predicted short-subunit dehydrogenase-like oxidoreductase (DUF2520 family)